MFPLEGENPTRHTHYVLWIIIISCIILAFAPLFNSGKKEVFLEWGYIPADHEDLKMFTSMFFHGGRGHIIGNMFFLWMFGDNVEDVIGHVFFLICYLICGVVATMTYASFHPGSFTPLIGASGAISGIVGMYLVFFPKVSAEIIIFIFHWEIHNIKTTIFAAVGCWFLIQLLLGIFIEATVIGEYIRIAFSAHAGGFIMGLILGFIFVKLGYIDRYIHDGKKHWLLGYAI